MREKRGGEREDSRREKRRAEGRKTICHVAVFGRGGKRKREKEKENGGKRKK